MARIKIIDKIRSDKRLERGKKYSNLGIVRVLYQEEKLAVSATSLRQKKHAVCSTKAKETSGAELE